MSAFPPKTYLKHLLKKTNSRTLRARTRKRNYLGGMIRQDPSPTKGAQSAKGAKGAKGVKGAKRKKIA